MKIGVIGAGAFGTALAISLARGGRDVMLWGRDRDVITEAVRTRVLPRLPDARLPDTVALTTDLSDLGGRVLLLAVPAQQLAGLLGRADFPRAEALIAACKGIDLTQRTGPTGVITRAQPGVPAGILTGPSFASDIAAGLPTALTLALADAALVEELQTGLSTETLRLYRSTDPVGAELGGALKNVIAIAAGHIIGAGLGDSARAALMTRGFVEMSRLAVALGARPETLTGLSGFGDLVLTCTSEQSRNYRHGLALGRGESGPEGVTVEGVATAKAARALAQELGIDMPITSLVAAVTQGEMPWQDAMSTLLSRDLKAE